MIKQAICIFAVGMLSVAPALADLSLFVDSAPNVYGSPNWAPWWASTKADVIGGSFTNMRTGTYPGTTTMDPYDEIVYSTGDLGKRTHWIYALPGESVASLDGRFEVKFSIDWGGTEYTWDWNTNSWVPDAPEAGWAQPGSWEDYSDGGNSGVIGSFGFAWWAGDNEAAPFDTGGSPYDETDQADVDALRDDVLAYQTHTLGQVRIRDSALDPWNISTLNVDVIPAPDAALLAVVGLLFACRWRRDLH